MNFPACRLPVGRQGRQAMNQFSIKEIDLSCRKTIENPKHLPVACLSADRADRRNPKSETNLNDKNTKFKTIRPGR